MEIHLKTASMDRGSTSSLYTDHSQWLQAVACIRYGITCLGGKGEEEEEGDTITGIRTQKKGVNGFVFTQLARKKPIMSFCLKYTPKKQHFYFVFMSNLKLPVENINVTTR